MNSRTLTLAALFSLIGGGCLPIPQTIAQESEETSTEETCRAEPDSQNGDDPDSGQLTETLERCDGVLEPPRTGDSDTEAPAPDIGRTPVVPPGALPEQQGNDTSGGTENPVTDEAAETGSDIDNIVAAIAKSSTVAQRIEEWRSGSPVNVGNVSIMFQGAKRAVLDTSLREHGAGVEQLQAAVWANPMLAEELESHDVIISDIIAADLEEGASLTIYVR